MRALIIVDIQYDFVTGGKLEVPNGEQVIPLVNTLTEHFDLVVATQDWHPANHKSFASNHPGKNPFEIISLNGLEQVLWPDHCVQGTRGADFHEQLNMNKVQAIFRKGMDPEIDSYSGFYDNGHKRSTGLRGYLKERDVKEVYVCGLAADYCVFFTVRDALKDGLKTFLVEDATRPINKEGFKNAKKEVVGLGGAVINSEEILG